MHNMKSNSQIEISLINVCQGWTPLLFRILSFFFIYLFSVVPLASSRPFIMYVSDRHRLSSGKDRSGSASHLIIECLLHLY